MNAMRMNKLTGVRASLASDPGCGSIRHRRLAACVTASLLAATSAPAQLVQAPQSGPRLNVQMLPDMGRGSEATCAVRVPDSGTILIGGKFCAADHTIWRAAYWTANDDSISGPNTLPDLGHGGEVNASIIRPDRDGAAEGFAVGRVADDVGRSHPAAWVGIGAEANLVVLPTPENAGGQAHGVASGDFNNDGIPDIAVCGFIDVTDGASNTMMAAIWYRAGDGNDTFALHLLPSLAPGAESAALSISHTYDSDLGSQLQASGYSFDDAGNRVAARFELTIDGHSMAVRALVSMPDGYDSVARTEFVSHDETIAIGGSIRNPQGVERPALYDTDGDARITLLTLPGGATGGRVNSIIAILIGLVAGGEVDTPQGQSAAVWGPWTEDRNHPGEYRAIDLNQIESNRPQGVRLLSVNALLPYIEQDNLIRFVGVASHASGRRQGFIGSSAGASVGSDHAWGSSGLRVRR